MARNDLSPVFKKTLKHVKISSILILAIGLLFVMFNFEGLGDLEGNAGVFVLVVIPSTLVLLTLTVGIAISYFLLSKMKSRKNFLITAFFVCLFFSYLIPIPHLITATIKSRAVGHYDWSILGILFMLVASTVLFALNYWCLVRFSKSKELSKNL